MGSRQHRSELAFHVFDLLMKGFVVSLMVSIAAAQILAGLLILVFIFLCFNGYPYRKTPLDIPILAFVAVRLLSIWFSIDPGLSMRAIGREIGFYGTYFYCAFYFTYAAKRNIRSTFQWLIISTLIVTAISVAMMLSGKIEKANGLSGGGLLSTHLLFVLVLTMTATAGEVFPSEWTRWTAFSALTIGLLFTLTRGDWIAATVAAVVYGLFVNRKLVIGLVAVAALLFVLVPRLRARFETLASPLEHSSDRVTLWHDARTHISDHPVLGFGPETFPLVFNSQEVMRDKKVNAWHNDFLQIYMESGLAGDVTLAVMLGALGYCAFVILGRTKSPTAAASYGWLGVLLLIGYLIDGCFTMPTSSITNAMLFRFLAAGVAVDFLKKKTAVTVEDVG